MINMKLIIDLRDEKVSPLLSQQAQFAANDTKDELPEQVPTIPAPKRVRVRARKLSE